MLEKDIINLIKCNLKLKLHERYDGASQRDGVKICLKFMKHDLGSIYLWQSDNAGFAELMIRFLMKINMLKEND